jgi:spoIIIJ-associated protein
LETLEISAATVEEATQIALDQLGKTRDEVEIAVLTEGNRGLLGIGGEDARILVTPKEGASGVGEQTEEDETKETAKEVLETLLRMMNVDATVTVKPTYESSIGEGFVCVIDIAGDDLGELIGRRGNTLGSLQFITNLIASRVLNRRIRILVDVEGYRLRRESSLRTLAERMAKRVEETGRPITLESMPANERRIVHLALSENPSVTTSSIDEGEQRRVVVSPQH